MTLNLLRNFFVLPTDFPGISRTRTIFGDVAGEIYAPVMLWRLSDGVILPVSAK
jgi:hypothetical protein